MNEPFKKITEDKMVIWGVFLIGVDSLCFLLDLTILGAAIAVVIQGFVNLWMTQWLKNMGGNVGGVSQQILRYALSVLPSGNFWVFVVSAVIHNKLENAPVLGKFV